MSSTISATVTRGRQSVVVQLTDPQDGERLAKMLAAGGQVALAIEQVFLSPDGDGLPPKPRAAPTGTCRGIDVLPDVEHGPPGRGQAQGFCRDCVKRIPRSKREEIYEPAKGEAE